MIARLLARLHQDRSASIMPLILAAMLIFMMSIALILNNGQSVTDKTRTQNGADAAAMLQADWAARHLNILSMNNTALTQMFTAMVVSATVAEAVINIGGRAAGTAAQIGNKAADYCPKLGFWPLVLACGAFYVAVAAPALATSWKAVHYWNDYQPMNGAKVAKNAITALNKFNDLLAESFAARVGSAVRESLAPNDIDSVFYFPPCVSGSPGCRADRQIEGPSLPAEPGGPAAMLELCEAASSGTSGGRRGNFSHLGYPGGKGPYTAGGSSKNLHVRDYITRETGLGEMHQHFYDTYPRANTFNPGAGMDTLKFSFDFEVSWFETWHWEMWVPIGTTVPPLFDKRQTVDKNWFTETMNTNWDIACASSSLMRISVSGWGDSFDGLAPKPYVLKGASAASQFLPGVFGQAASLMTDYKDLTVVAFAARNWRFRLSADLYESAFETDYAYAQAWIFNPTSFDLYTQDWQATLTPAKRMDQPAEVFTSMQSRAPRAFDILAKVAASSGDSNALGALNHH